MSEPDYLKEELLNYEVTISKSDPTYDGNTTIEVIFPNAEGMILGQGFSIEEAVADVVDNLIKALSKPEPVDLPDSFDIPKAKEDTS